MTGMTTAELLYIEECGYQRALREYGIGGYGRNKFEAAVLAERDLSDRQSAPSAPNTPTSER